jgi:hypothetical protein
MFDKIHLITHHSKRNYMVELFDRFPTIDDGLVSDGSYRQQIYRENVPSVYVPTYVKSAQDAPTFGLNQRVCVRYVGYFQCPAYFEHCKDELVSILRPEPDFVRNSLDRWKVSVPWDRAVFLHARLGDYVNADKYWDPDSVGEFYDASLCDLTKASAPVTVLIFSNGTESDVRLHFPRICARIAELGMELKFADEPDELVALYAMMRCGIGGIVPNSTFSWWAAYVGWEPGRIYYHFGWKKGLDAFPLRPDRGVILWNADDGSTPDLRKCPTAL